MGAWVGQITLMLKDGDGGQEGAGGHHVRSQRERPLPCAQWHKGRSIFRDIQGALYHIARAPHRHRRKRRVENARSYLYGGQVHAMAKCDGGQGKGTPGQRFSRRDSAGRCQQHEVRESDN